MKARIAILTLAFALAGCGTIGPPDYEAVDLYHDQGPHGGYFGRNPDFPIPANTFSFPTDVVRWNPDPADRYQFEDLTNYVGEVWVYSDDPVFDLLDSVFGGHRVRGPIVRVEWLSDYYGTETNAWVVIDAGIFGVFTNWPGRVKLISPRVETSDE